MIAPNVAPISRPPAVAQIRSIVHQRQPPLPRSCNPRSPRPSITKGNAVPSFKPPSPERLKRRRSGCTSLLVCTPEASTGSVGARMPPSNTAAPSGSPSPQKPTAVISPTVSAMDMSAKRSGSLQRLSENGTAPIFNPTLNSEISTATSATHSSTSA
ncbi:hypothetical protein D3C85_1192090 [compost metagenome]